MKTTDYFKRRVLIERPYLEMAWIERVLANPYRLEEQLDGRFRYWGFVEELGRYMRVIVEPDGETVHNAFPDSNFRP